MANRLSDQEFVAASRLPIQQRYQYFLKRVSDSAWIWGLKKGEGWAVAVDEQGREFVAVWSHPRYATACASGEWAGATPERLNVHEWIEEWTHELVRDGKGVNVFLVPDDSGASVGPLELKEDLELYLALLE